jgi:hypothetical protein
LDFVSSSSTVDWFPEKEIRGEGRAKKVRGEGVACIMQAAIDTFSEQGQYNEEMTEREQKKKSKTNNYY